LGTVFEEGLAERVIGAKDIARCPGATIPRWFSTTPTGLRR
jgi:hypothetical protein